MDRPFITVEITIDANIDKIWDAWANPNDIMQWNNLSPDWHTTRVENDLRPGGRFVYAMGLKDGSFGFDFKGTYDEVITHERITYTLHDERRAIIEFKTGRPVSIVESFEPTTNELAEIQRDFCQAVLTSFKNYVES